MVIQAVFLPLIHLCTSESYKARTWVEANQELLQTYFVKYTRSFPVMFLDTSEDLHLEIVKQRSKLFQNIMRTLKTKGWIVTKEEHSKKAQKIQEDISRVYLDNSKINRRTALELNKNALKKNQNCSGSKNVSQPFVDYSSIIQYNFGKLKMYEVQHEDTVPQGQQEQSEIKNKTIEDFETKNTITEYDSKLEITQFEPEISVPQNNEILEKINTTDFKIYTTKTEENKTGKTSASNSLKKKTSDQEIKERFTEGYQLFQMEEEPLISDSSSEEESIVSNDSCKLINTYMEEKYMVVTDEEVANTMFHLQEIFTRIVRFYDLAWKQRYEEGYTGFQGDSEGLLKLMKVLPALESCHMQILIKKWNNFCDKIKYQARKNHIIYAATVSEMQLFLLDFETQHDKKYIKILGDIESSYNNSCTNKDITVSNLQNSEDLNCLISTNLIDAAGQIKVYTTNIHSTHSSNEELLYVDILNKSSNKEITLKEINGNCFENNDISESDFTTTCNINEDLNTCIWEFKHTENNKITTLDNTKSNKVVSEDQINSSEKGAFKRTNDIITEKDDLSNLKTDFEPVSTKKSDHKSANSTYNKSYNMPNIVNNKNINKQINPENVVAFNYINSYIPKASKKSPQFEHFHPLAMCFKNLSRYE